MKQILVAALVVAALAVVAPRAEAYGREVGLGVSLGAVFPAGSEPDLNTVGFNWGFWVDIPIAWKFHITPSAEVYNISGAVSDSPMTDIVMNFKFILPLGFTKVFFGGAGGITVAQEYDGNAGVLAGVSFNLVSSLDLFVQAKYKVIIKDPNIHVVHTNAGFLIWF